MEKILISENVVMTFYTHEVWIDLPLLNWQARQDKSPVYTNAFKFENDKLYSHN